MQMGQMEHQLLQYTLKTWFIKSDTVKARKSLSNSWDHNLENKRYEEVKKIMPKITNNLLTLSMPIENHKHD